MPSLAQLTRQPLTFKLVTNERLGAPSRSFFMRPTMKQVEKDGLLLWEVSHGGIVRFFKHDWQAKWHFESCVRLYRSRLTGKQG
jgi:hypothetical protein